MSEIPKIELDARTLYGIAGAVAQGPDLDAVLAAVVDLLVDATACHACFVYLIDESGNLLQMRAASPVFSDAVGHVTFSLDEGLAGWVARHRKPAFIREDALSDPRMKLVPELNEERFQSMVAVPLSSRVGEVIGVVVLHTEAPREFEQETLDLLVHAAALVAGAIDNARLYDRTRRHLTALTALAELSRDLTSLTARGDLYEAGAGGVLRLLDCEAGAVLLLTGGGYSRIVAAAPDRRVLGSGPYLHDPDAGWLAAELRDGSEIIGTMIARRRTPFSADEIQVLEAFGGQLAVALGKAELIERLEAENLIRDLFEALSEGHARLAAGRARAAGWSEHAPFVLAVARPTADSGDNLDAVAAAITAAATGALVYAGTDDVRALIPLGQTGPSVRLGALLATFRAIGQAHRCTIGISRVWRQFKDGTDGLREAIDAATIEAALEPDGGAASFDALGAYRYLAPLAGATPPDPVHAAAIDELADYDDRRSANLTATLEQFLADRGSIAATARALMIHPNTARQRLRRVEELTGLTLRNEDQLSLELGLKLARLRRANTQKQTTI